MSKKIDYTKAEQLQEETYFNCKVDMIQASLKETFSNIGKGEPHLVLRELLVDGLPFIGIEYGSNGEIANVYTTDAKGKRVNFENAAEERIATAPDLIAQRLEEVRNMVPEHEHTATKEAPTPEKKKVVSPRKIDARTAAKAARGNVRA